VPVLVTERLILRRPRTDDLQGLHGVLSQDRAMRYWSTPAHTMLQQTRGWLAAMIAGPPDASDDFIIERDGSVIGKAGAWRLPEVGFTLDPAVWGQGLAHGAWLP
jgi:RimJ/RimL family protein N-acetyltransferase